MQYIKHYYVDENNNSFCCELTPEPKYKRQPLQEYPGLDVKVWLTDAEGVDVCLAEVPDTTPVSTIVSPCGKNSVQVLSEVEYNSVITPYFEAQALFGEAQIARLDGDEDLSEQKQLEGEAKLQDALTAIRAL